jgi:gamma-glutamyltranspeptidase/glutathione hydrolase
MSYKTKFTTRPVITGTFGVVSSTHWIASQVGMLILEKGGNAFDAAVAAGLTLQVIEPHMNGLGGETIIIIRKAGEAPSVVCGQGVAPAAATSARYRREGIRLVPSNGLLAAVVPGAFDAWMIMLRDYGTMKLSQVIEPAIGYAKNGFPLLSEISTRIAAFEHMFRKEWPSSAAVYLPGNEVPKPDAVFSNPPLADTYLRILQEANASGANRERQIEAARNAFYKGFVAESIELFATRTEVMDVSGQRHKGILTASDLASWQAAYEQPASYDYRGYTVYKAGPWSQGPVLLQMLALLKGFDIERMDANGPDFVHTLVEAFKLALADREAWYGDDKFFDVPMKALLSDSYNEARRKLIGTDASFDIRPGFPDRRQPRLPTSLAAEQPTLNGVARNGARDGANALLAAESDTCHLDVIDRHGNVVAATPSGGWMGQSPVVPGLGFSLGTRAQTFWLEEGLPSSLGPLRRPRTTLTPTLAVKHDADAALAFGSPGGDPADQWTAQFFLRHIEHGLNLQEAIDAPTMHTDHVANSFHPRDEKPGKLLLESRFPDATVAELRARGHDVDVRKPWSLGRVSAASVEGSILRAAATARLQQSYAVGR